jgi:hypothetical protein
MSLATTSKKTGRLLHDDAVFRSQPVLLRAMKFSQDDTEVRKPATIIRVIMDESTLQCPTRFLPPLVETTKDNSILTSTHSTHHTLFQKILVILFGPEKLSDAFHIGVSPIVVGDN